MEKIRIFQNPKFGTVRVTKNEQGEPLFCLKDVCKVLALRTQKVVQRLEDDVLSKYPIVDKLGRTQQAIFVNEDGLYDTILDSRKEEAKQFRKWITSEVLPNIRKYGGYMMAAADEPDEVIMARALQIMHITLQRRDEKIAELQPKAQYAEEVLLSETCLPTTVIAKGLGMTARALNKLLKDHRIQYNMQNGQWVLYDKYDNMGLTQQRTHLIKDKDGRNWTNTYTVWTEKGKQFIHDMVRQWKQEQTADLFAMDNDSRTINLNTHIDNEEVI